MYLEIKLTITETQNKNNLSKKNFTNKKEILSNLSEKNN